MEKTGRVCAENRRTVLVLEGSEEHVGKIEYARKEDYVVNAGILLQKKAAV